MSVVINKDWLHSYLRKYKISSRSSHVSEWEHVLVEHSGYVVLHLKDGRRLMGWVKIRPSDPQNGHFFITLPCWLEAEKDYLPIKGTEGLLINVTEIDFIEFLQEQKEQA